MFRAFDEALAEAVDTVADDIEAAAAKVRKKGFVAAISDDINESFGGAIEVVSEELGVVAKSVGEKGIIQSIGEDLAGVADHIFGATPQRRRPKKERRSKDDLEGTQDYISAQRELAEASAAAEASAKAAMKAVASPEKSKSAAARRKAASTPQKSPQAPAPLIDLMNQPDPPLVQQMAPEAQPPQHVSPTCAWPPQLQAAGHDLGRGVSVGSPSAGPSPPDVLLSPACVQVCGSTHCTVGTTTTRASKPVVSPIIHSLDEEFGAFVGSAPAPAAMPVSPPRAAPPQSRPVAPVLTTPTGGMKLYDLMSKDAKQLGQCITASDIVGEAALQKPEGKKKSNENVVELEHSDPFAECRWVQ